MGVTRITQKGQITIPKDVRDGLKVKPSDSVVVVMDGDHAMIYAARERKLTELRGQLPATRPYPGVDEVRAEVGRRMAARGTRKKR